MPAKLNTCLLICEPWSNGLILNLLIMWERTLESTNLCICCCRCSPEAPLWLYLYVYLEALGVQEVQGAPVVQAHLLHLCTKHSVRTQESRNPAENCMCPQDIHRTASLFLKRFLSTEDGAINSLKCSLLKGEPDRTSQGAGHQCILSLWITGPLEGYKVLLPFTYCIL